MADETEQDPVERGTDEIDVEINIVDDVNEIPKNKHDAKYYNYNSGVVALKCVINGRCPIIRQPLVDNTLVFNSETIRGFSEEDLQNLLFVPGEDGIFLAEKYIYRSNFLFVQDEEVVPSGPGGNTDSGSAQPPEYKEEQSWFVAKNVFDPDSIKILKPTDYLTNSLLTTGNVIGSRWTIVRETVHTDSDQTSQSAGATSSNLNESADSAVYAPSQVAASPTTVDCIIKSSGIHWRVIKKTPLFKGEDFFVEFRARAIADDFKNIDSIEFKDSSYDFLDAVRSMQGSKEEFPANSGIVTYDMERDEKNSEPTGKWKKIEESVPFFDLNKQSYYIIEMGTESSDVVRYFIIITMKANPTFVKVVDGKSYYIDKYKEVTGEALINQPRLRITVRNHLGKLVISFLGLESNPWIISDRKINKDDLGILIVPAAKLSIWGGNLASSFMFGPLQYSSEYTLELPQSEKTKKNPLNPVEAFKEKEPYELPLIGAAYNVALLSARDRGIDAGSKFVNKQDENSSSSGAAANPENSGDETGGTSSESYLEGREPMFTSDMQYALEAKVTVSADGEAATPGQFEQPMATYFLNTGRYIKSTIEEQSDEEQFTEQVSNTSIDPFLPGGNSFNSSAAIQSAIDDAQSNSNIDFAPPVDMASRLELEILLKKDVDIQNAQNEYLDAQLNTDEIELGLNNPDIPTSEHDLQAAEDAEEIAKNNLEAVSQGTNSRNTQRYMQFYLRCRFVAGHHKFKNWKLLNCKTPVLTNIRLVCIPNKDEPAWKEEPVDVSGHVMKFSDSWSSQDFHTMEHTGSISFLINQGLSIPNNQSEYLQSIQSKAFYIEVWAGYQGCNYSQLDGIYKLFTGLCFGGIITVEAGKRIMDCQILDYSKICQESYLFNSPFFDGMRDLNAIRELSDMIGFRSDEGSPDAPDPGYLVKMAAETETNDNLVCATPDGRGYTTSPYALPASYDRIQQPFYRFSDGSAFWENMQTLTQKAGKVIFFDAYGMLHYEELPIMKLMYGNISPEDVPVLWEFVKLPDGEGQQIFNSLVDEKAVSDVFNSINIMTSTPDYEMIINSDVNWDSISDPNSPGFLGYKKIFFQQDGIFGSLESTKNLINQYKLFYRAPIVYKFETYGQPMRCFDIASVDGQKLIIVNVSSEISKVENKWWQTIEGEWYHGETTV